MRTPHSRSWRRGREQWRWVPDVALTSSSGGAAAHQVPSPGGIQCRGMTLLSAVHTCFEQLPVLVPTSRDAEHATRRRSVSSLVEIWIEEEFAKNGGRQPESVEVLP